MKKFLLVLFVFISIQLSACQSDVYEKDSVIMKEEYSESSRGNGIFEVLAILGVVYVLANLGKK
ncbi:MAG: hypothetical protein RLZZ384_190 [Pseudomonadota bacterium]|jgi:hypothetical protein